jgi:predicted esterase
MMIFLFLAFQDVVEMKEHRSNYLLLSPVAYVDTKSWPLILHLEPRTEGPEAAARRWKDEGHVVVIPHRKDLSGEREIAFLLDCLKDVKGRLRIDPERVFLSGKGEGADLAVALAIREPELWAACGASGIIRAPEISGPIQRPPFHLSLSGNAEERKAGQDAAAALSRAGAKVVQASSDLNGGPGSEPTLRKWFDAQGKPRDSIEAVDGFLAQGRILDATLEALKLMDREKDQILVRAKLEKIEAEGIITLGNVEIAFANRKWLDAYLKCRRAAAEYAWAPVGETIRKRLKELEAHPRVKKALEAGE